MFVIIATVGTLYLILRKWRLTFVMLYFTPVQRADNILPAFFARNIFTYTNQRCRGYRNSLSTIARVGLSNGKCGTVFCCTQTFKYAPHANQL